MSSSIDAERPFRWLLFAGLLLSTGLLLAGGGAAAADAEGSQAHSDVQVGAGDLLEIRVWREPDLSGEHRVGVDGRLHHVLAGELAAEGLSTAAIATELRERLERDYLREARVAVTLVSSPRQRASVLGAVARPGPYPLAGTTRVLDLVFAAGGVTSDSVGSAVLLRAPDGSEGQGAEPAEPAARPLRIDFDLAALLEGGDLSLNSLILAGDVLLIESVAPSVSSGPAEIEARVRVLGEVKRPGRYPLSEAGSLLDAVLAAGGLEEYAAGNRARLVRSEEGERLEQRVRLGDLLGGRAGQENLELRDGDLLIVPESFF